jgi:glycosyltransferase involved in cell wall biosynthesis
MNVFRHIDTKQVCFDFLVEAVDGRDYDEEILDLGGRIIRSPAYRHRGRFSAAFVDTLRSEGPFAVVHAHGRHNSGLSVTIARAMGIPVRIGHVHNVKDTHTEDVVRRTYKRGMKALLSANASWILGCSTPAVESLYGVGCVDRSPKIEVLPYGIDLDRFTPTDSRLAIREELDISPSAKVCGHVGRFVWEKNHAFLLDVFAELVARDSDWILLLVGDGKLRGELEARVRELGIEDNVRLAGVRPDVPELMCAMDVMAFPSLLEGFGLVMVEAQAVGLASVISENISTEVTVDPALITGRTLADGPGAWADTIETIYAAPRNPARSHELVRASRFAIDRSVRTLLGRYYGLGDGL